MLKVLPKPQTIFNNIKKRDDTTMNPLCPVQTQHISNFQLDKDIFTKKIFTNSPSFTSISRFHDGHVLDTGFFRGLKTLKRSKDEIRKQFPQGTTIIHAAGSVGQEAISNAILFENSLYKFISLDIDTDAIKLARQRIHAVFNLGFDSFLIEKEFKLSPEHKNLYRKFRKYFDEIDTPPINLNNSESYKNFSDYECFEEKFFKLKDEYKNIVEFPNASYGDILDIDKFSPGEKVGAIYCRNALYHMTKNNCTEHILNGYEPNKINTDAIEQIVSKIHFKLEDNGFLILGNHAKEHLFILPKDSSNARGIKFINTSFYKQLEPYQKRKTKNLVFAAESPLEMALKLNGRFKPVFWDSIDGFPEIEMPTIWQKCPT